jgi:hypothetical protein
MNYREGMSCQNKIKFLELVIKKLQLPPHVLARVEYASWDELEEEKE